MVAMIDIILVLVLRGHIYRTPAVALLRITLYENFFRIPFYLFSKPEFPLKLYHRAGVAPTLFKTGFPAQCRTHSFSLLPESVYVFRSFPSPTFFLIGLLSGACLSHHGRFGGLCIELEAIKLH